jgi:short-chain fatty acids transporter
MLQKLGQRFESFFRATAPDPFVLAVGLTVVVFALAMIVEGTGPVEVVRAWQGDAGFWSLLAFSMQMVLILVTGHALAATRPVRALIRRVSRWPRDGAQAAALVAFVAIGCALLNWGLGLIVGALLAREVGRVCAARGVRAHYPLLVAAGYSGLMCWHGGLSGTAPLKMTTAGDVERFLGAELAATVDPVPFTETVLSLQNVLVSGGLWLLVPLLAYRLAPRAAGAAQPIGETAAVEAEEPEAATPSRRAVRSRRAGLAAIGLALALFVAQQSSAAVARALAAAGLDGDASIVLLSLLIGLGAALVAPRPADERPPRTVPERLERSPVAAAVLVVLLAAACLRWLADVGIGALDPNAINLLFLTAGLILHGSLARYAAAIGEAVRGASGIVLQFPFYAGIMGVMRGTGLARDMASFIAEHAPPHLYTVVTFLSAGLVNLFVPSGGGQWAVQGPIAVDAARDLGLPLEQAILAVAYGDQWTNMLQPFWALPLLAITGIAARDILGYTTLFLLVGGLWMMSCLFVLSALALG